MKIILTQDVKKLGKKNELINVSDGYAKNYIIPKGLGLEATSQTLNEMKIKNKAEKNRKENELSNANALAEKISTLEIIFKSKAGEQGKLFGSITAKDIAKELLKKYKIEVDKRKIVLIDSAIKSLGTQEVDIKLYPGVITKLKVTVESE